MFGYVLGDRESVSSERLVDFRQCLPLAFLVAAEVPVQHHRSFPTSDQHHVARAHAATQGYTGECAPQVVESWLAELAIGICKLTLA